MGNCALHETPVNDISFEFWKYSECFYKTPENDYFCNNQNEEGDLGENICRSRSSPRKYLPVQISNTSPKEKCYLCSKLAIKTSERRQYWVFHIQKKKKKKHRKAVLVCRIFSSVLFLVICCKCIHYRDFWNLNNSLPIHGISSQ